MGHIHTVTDSEPRYRFIIDPVTRQITNKTGKAVLTKLDHNSECFTFEIPAEIEGHDMSTCNRVEVHFINIDSTTRETKTGVYPIEDFKKDDEKNAWTFTWLVSQNATQYAGTLSFAVRFACFSEEDMTTPVYSWRTAVFTGITIVDSIFAAEEAMGDYSDIIQSWLTKFESATTEVFVITEEGALVSLTDTLEELQDTTAQLSTDVAGLKTDLSNKANKAEVVKLSGDQTIEGIKTFSEYVLFNGGAHIKAGENLKFQAIKCPYVQLQIAEDSIASSGSGIVITLPSTSGTLALTTDIPDTGSDSVTNVMNAVYPVGSVFRSTVENARPEVGTWKLISAPSKTIEIGGTPIPSLQGETSKEYVISGTSTLGLGYGEVTISGGVGTPIVSYDSATGEVSWTLYTDTADNVTGIITAISAAPDDRIYEYERTE